MIALPVEQKAKIAAFLAAPLLARFATASPDTLQPHVVPVWYDWDGETLWISSYESTRKIGELRANPRCAVVVDVAESINGVSAVLFEGTAELITEPRDFVRDMALHIYARYLGPEGVLAPDPQEWANSPENLIIRVTPEFVKVW
ncbi:MAG TPA: pyridoxamine 5'-phosphate oxidase family protein [Anaerolineae bacterium]|nr:pyridoxamine 5'-phosphate oxidase family protein [Anaerolineae bacterium]HQK13889.1 pyridoxamine 5'-phosphate oxidase family protein [Anaerolineae bacterium]